MRKLRRRRGSSGLRGKKEGGRETSVLQFSPIEVAEQIPTCRHGRIEHVRRVEAW